MLMLLPFTLINVSFSKLGEMVCVSLITEPHDGLPNTSPVVGYVSLLHISG